MSDLLPGSADRKQLYALAQRIAVRARLRPLTDSELTLFLDKNLRAAGAKSNRFEPDAVTLAFQHSRSQLLWTLPSQNHSPRS